jgi:hypothetical protein
MNSPKQPLADRLKARTGIAGPPMREIIGNLSQNLTVLLALALPD